MGKHLKILTAKYLEEYSYLVNVDWHSVFNNLRGDDLLSKEDFKYRVQTSATYSSNIEGNSIKPDDYLKNKKFGVKSKPDEMVEIDDLVRAYNYAMNNRLTSKTFLEAHKILSKNLLTLERHRGKLRTGRMGIFSGEKLEYFAVESQFVKKEYNKLFHDIKELINRNLSYKEIFYYASMIHLVFEKIHPFEDGNGRVGRLLEKWFLAEKIGKNAWGIRSERYYSNHKVEYYKNIHIGVDYYSIDMDKSMNFLLMLPNALKNN